MRILRRGLLICLILTGLFALTLSDTLAQMKFPTPPTWGDYQWGVFNGNREYSRQGREDAVARHNYCPSGGCVLRLESVEVRPDKAKRGQTMVLSTTYTLLTPDGVAIPVAITRQVLFHGASLGQTKNLDMRKLNGTWTQEINFTLPQDARPGLYTLKTKVTTGYAMAEKETQFLVE